MGWHAGLLCSTVDIYVYVCMYKSSWLSNGVETRAYCVTSCDIVSWKRERIVCDIVTQWRRERIVWNRHESVLSHDVTQCHTICHTTSHNVVTRCDTMSHNMCLSLIVCLSLSLSHDVTQCHTICVVTMSHNTLSNGVETRAYCVTLCDLVWHCVTLCDAIHSTMRNSGMHYAFHYVAFHLCDLVWRHTFHYGVATIRRLLKIIGLFCRI